MNKERIEGAAQKAAGSIKQTAGKMTGDRNLRAEGLADKAAGATKQAFGKAKEAVHRATR